MCYTNVFEEKIVISREMVDLFIKITGDDNPIHTSQDFAIAAGYKEPVVHGMLAASMFGKILGNKFPGAGSVILERNFIFVRPVYVGEEYSMTIKVASVDYEKHVGTLKCRLKNSDGKLCIDCSTKIKNENRF